MGLRSCISLALVAIGGSLLLLIPACQPEEPQHSPLFDLMFASQEGTFRGLYLQDDISLVKRKESTLDPLYEDPLGLAYKLTSKEGDKIYIEYYTPIDGGDQPLTQISSIVVNAILTDEAKASQFYAEILSHLTQKYRQATGAYDFYLWEGALQPEIGTQMEVILKLDESKNKITLNYVSKP